MESTIESDVPGILGHCGDANAVKRVFRVKMFNVFISDDVSNTTLTLTLTQQFVALLRKNCRMQTRLLLDNIAASADATRRAAFPSKRGERERELKTRLAKNANHNSDVV